MVGPRKEALAAVDNAHCVACMRCIDSCDDDAMLARLREEPLVVGFDGGGVDQLDVLAVGHAAGAPAPSRSWPCSPASSRVA
jgi:ferredoxin